MIDLKPYYQVAKANSFRRPPLLLAEYPPVRKCPYGRKQKASGLFVPIFQVVIFVDAKRQNRRVDELK